MTSRMGPGFISLSIGRKLPLTTEMKTGPICDVVTENFFSSGGYPPSGLRVPEAGAVNQSIRLQIFTLLLNRLSVASVRNNYN